MAQGRAAGVSAVLVSACCFGSMAIFARWAAAEGVGLGAVLFLRFALAGSMLAAWMRVRGQPWPRGRNLWILIGMGGIGYVGQSSAYFAALSHASAALVALLLYLYPVLVTLLAAALARRWPSRARGAAVLLALAGTALTLGGERHADGYGLALGIGAALIYSVYILVGGRVMQQEHPLAAATVVMLAAAAVFGGAVLAIGTEFPASARGWSAVVLIAVLSTVVAIGAFFFGMQRLGAADAATLSTLEPLVTAVLAALLLGERLGGLQIVGGIAILGAVVFLARLPQAAAVGGKGC